MSTLFQIRSGKRGPGKTNSLTQEEISGTKCKAELKPLGDARRKRIDNKDTQTARAENHRQELLEKGRKT